MHLNPLFCDLLGAKPITKEKLNNYLETDPIILCRYRILDKYGQLSEKNSRILRNPSIESLSHIHILNVYISLSKLKITVGEVSKELEQIS